MKNIAIITARSGSKGLKDKNIKLLEGKPLLAYSIEAALQTGLFDCVHVSTDSGHYADIARQYGADVPFLRDAELATDTAGTWDVLRAVVNRYLQLGQQFDTVTLLQPTSPLRDAEDIRAAFDIFKEKAADSVISVCEVEHSPKLCNTLGADNSMNGFVDLCRVGCRQEMDTYYRLNGAIYIQKTSLLMEQGNLYGENSYAYVMSQEHSVDIDTELDFLFAETIMRELF
ncbi:MAG: acylneuraminate cytidylyltransferase family protein [Agathobacter sp.]|nr:acylneuraminate cytidylyltransferase family protein [Agathobacter sp.]